MNRFVFWKGIFVGLGLLMIFLLFQEKPAEVVACRTPRPTFSPTPAPIPTDSPTSEPTATPVASEPPSSETETGGLSAAGAPVCTDAKPNAPYLVSATSLTGNKVRLVWQKVESADDYVVFYGTKSGEYLYGVPATGNTDNFVVNDIASGCFVIRAVNGCMPGDPSNEVCTGTSVAGQVLGATTMADTGSNNKNVYYFILFLGIELMIGGIISYAKAK